MVTIVEIAERTAANGNTFCSVMVAGDASVHMNAEGKASLVALKASIPSNLPKNVADKFLQAERLSNQNDMRDPAGNAYRATLERSILHIDASLTGGNLYSKIEKLAKNGQITDDLKNFAHQIRNLGNDATHNDDDITQEELNNLRIFTRMFLMYVFTLPAMIPQTVKPFS